MITRDSKNILVADDSLFFRTKLSDILMEAGHRVTFANDGKGVISRLEANPASIDLLILDLQMPEVDGFGVLRWINDNGLRGRFQVLTVTGVYEKDDVRDTLKSLGVGGFMSKNFPPEKVVFWVNSLLFAEKIVGVRNERIAVSIPVDFTLGNVTKTGVMINLSEGGAFIHTSAMLSEGMLLDLKFSLPGSERVLCVKGTVRWFPDSGPGSMFSGCGIMFTALSPEFHEMLRAFINTELKRLERISVTNRA